MGSEYFKHPAKRLDREFRSMGAVRVERTSANVAYRFPDGARRLVPTNITAGKARLILQAMQDRYGFTNIDPLGFTERRPGAPTIDLERLSTSEHARERFDLMRCQAGLTFQEILVALRAPARVLWATNHAAWLYVGDRIAVSADVDTEGYACIRTVLWTSQELWDQNPRPEKALV